MKTRKIRKDIVDKNGTRLKTRKIGRVFNPMVRLMQVFITALVIYFFVYLCAVYVVPVIGGMLATVVDMSALDNWTMLLTMWIFPYLFVVAMLFVGALTAIKMLAVIINRFSEKLIVDYKAKQEEFHAKAND